MNTPARYILTLLIALTLGASWLLDGPSDTQAAQDVATDADYAAAQADGGAAKCAQLGRTPAWTAEGDLICRAGKPAKAVVAQGAQP